MHLDLSPFFEQCSYQTAMDAFDFLKRGSIRGPLDHYSYCKDLLYRCQVEGLSTDKKTKFLQACRYPYAEVYQPSVAVLALLARLFSTECSSIDPTLLPSGAPFARTDRKELQELLPIPVAYQLALLWEQLGKFDGDRNLEEKASALKSWARRFPPVARYLFLPEIQAFFAEDPFWKTSDRHSGQDRDLGLVYGSQGAIDAAWACSGANSGFGAMQFGDVTIVAFGPQEPPLNCTDRFGLFQAVSHGAVITKESGGFGVEGWSRCFADKEAWIHFMALMKESEVKLSFCVQGAFSNRAVLSFYVKASSCSLASKKRFFPKRLDRYRGEVQPLFLNDQISFIPKRVVGEMEIIPLAGEGCFWNADFLVTYSLSSLLELSIS